MKYVRILFLSALIMAIVGCNNDDIPVPEKPAWRKFEGVYHVTKLENQEQYQMKISFDTLLSGFGENKLHVIYENFDASFDSLTGVFLNTSNVNRIRDFNAPFGVSDYDGARWSLNMLPNAPNTSEQENTLVNDTILFCFRKINVAFYMEDGVPFYECECKHLAVKVD